MKTIWKFKLSSGIIEIPKNSIILTVQTQHEKPYLWAIVDPIDETEKRYFNIYGTGHDLPNNPGIYIGTFQVLNEDFVFHVFEVDKQTNKIIL